MNVPESDPSKPLLKLTGVRFGFDEGTPLLESFDLSVQRGEFVTLLGPSGCGKSTILNLAAGLIAPRSGQVSFDGAPLSGVNLNIGYMTQGDTSLPWLTVAQNVVLPLELRGVPRAERQRRLVAALERVNLSERANFYPSALSGGMKRRVLLARSLIYDPPMLLMDEPFAALDAQLRETMHKELRATVTRLEESVLFVTHDIAESILLSDRVLVLRGRPLRVELAVEVPWARDRDLDAVRVSGDFVRLESELRQCLRAGVGSRPTPSRVGVGEGAVIEAEARR